MPTYYNEHDPYAAQWLRNLIAAGHIAPGDVDERDIQDVTPSDLDGYTQCHFFAGIGVWSLALRQAGWPDDAAVWTGSCPCQPFSAAGKGGGFGDERHLWPAWFHLISQYQPTVVFGEQVASPDGYAWLDLVQTDMEAAGYAFGPVVLTAAGVGAPHARHRIYFVADAGSQRLQGVDPLLFQGRANEANTETPWSCEAGGLANNNNNNNNNKGLEGRGQPECECAIERVVGARSVACELADTDDAGTDGRASGGEQPLRNEHTTAGPTAGYWAAADWLLCRDDKWRPVEPGTFPLAHGVAARMGKLRAYGNAIVVPVAKNFIRAYMDVMTG